MPGFTHSNSATHLWHSRTLSRLAVVLLAAGMMGCERSPESQSGDPLAPLEAHVTSAAAPGGAPLLASQLAEVRALSAKFHVFQASQDAGWVVPVSGCVENQPAGAMGIHYLNPAYADGNVTPLEPEVVIYEPQKDGSQKFVGVEYIIPYAFLPETATPPVLFGESFLQNPNNQLWMMHVWIGRHNPDGLLATWNPQVTCQFAN